MKICPTCQTRYQDDTLSFCLDDGTPLVVGPQADTPTVVLGEPETFVARSGYGPHSAQPSEVTRVQSFEQQQPPKSGSNTALVVTVTVLLMLLLFVAIGVGVLLYINSGGPTITNVNTNVAIPPPNLNSNFNSNLPVTNTYAPPSPLPTVSMPSNTNTVERPPAVTDDGQSRSEISRLVNSWKSSLESRDLEGYMDNYASTLDYYTRSGMSRSAVRADKARAFNNYSSMRVNISNMSVTSDGPGLATATFDKEWTFSGSSTSSGKVRSQLKFREIGGKWLIVSERDVRVYYPR
jgi:ketosteroid isomerase-like protein